MSDYKNSYTLGIPGPYFASTTEANEKTPSTVRYIGKTVLIVSGNTASEYWYQGGIADVNLVAKSTGGGGGSQNLQQVMVTGHTSSTGYMFTGAVTDMLAAYADISGPLGSNKYMSSLLKDPTGNNTMWLHLMTNAANLSTGIGGTGDTSFIQMLTNNMTFSVGGDGLKSSLTIVKDQAYINVNDLSGTVTQIMANTNSLALRSGNQNLTLNNSVGPSYYSNSDNYPIEYSDDYSVNYTNRSLIDKGYADSIYSKTSDTHFGTFTVSGDGSTNVFNVPHGFTTVPSFVNIKEGSPDAGTNGGISYITTNSTNIIINYDAPPAPGTNNLKFYWSARK